MIVLVHSGVCAARMWDGISKRLWREIPHARQVVVEGAGHLPALERPDETARLVRQFLEESQDLSTP